MEKTERDASECHEVFRLSKKHDFGKVIFTVHSLREILSEMTKDNPKYRSFVRTLSHRISSVPLLTV